MTTAAARRGLPLAEGDEGTLAAAALDLFSGVGDDVVTRALDGLRAVALAPGEALDVSATRAACCVVRAGRLALRFCPPELRDRTIGLLEEGDVLVPPADLWAAVGPGLQAEATEPSVVLLVERDRLEAWMREPALAVNLLRALAAQVADRELAVAIALETTVERRVLLKLRQLGERFGRVTPDGVRLDLRLTHQDLADMVGAARESVTIALGSLARQGEIGMRRRTIVIRRRTDGGCPG